jgi:hypothetical protein
MLNTTKVSTLALISVWLFILLLFFNLQAITKLNQIFKINHLTDINESNFKKENQILNEPSINNYKNEDISTKIPVYYDKFIIITTINEPTEHLKYINDALYGWCLLVIGDKKTAPNWKYKNVYYLSVDEQLKLAKNYKLVDLIPFNSYLRKLVGYLFAIENKANYIYETDDDHSPLDGLFGFRYEHFKGLETDNCQNENVISFINPYAFFGQPSVWPRGYPPDKISTNEPKCNRFRIFNQKVPLIQQGLVNGDPDVTRIKEKLSIKFDENAPPLVLNEKQYAPINSQNTFYHYDSFFTLIFPLNVTFRESDILRGYISIRLLQEIDGRVAFMPPNALQIRNSYNFHEDYLEEKRLYENIKTFVKDLDEWKCTAKENVKDCVIECIEMLVDKKHFEKTQINFYKAWIQDLDSIGYKWPQIKAKIESIKASTFVYYKSVEQERSSNSNKNEISLTMANLMLEQQKYLINLCNFEASFTIKPCQIDNLILITQAKTKEEIINLKLHFNYAILCLENKINVSIQDLTESFTIIKYNSTFSSCVKDAFGMGFRQQTFIVAKNLKNFTIFNDFKLKEMEQNISL